MRFWWILLLLPGAALAKTESWPQIYNQGVTAYRSNQFDQAARDFEQAAASADQPLRVKSFYNLGNSLYRLGESVGPLQARPYWERAKQCYQQAQALDPKDPDPKSNSTFVEEQIKKLPKPSPKKGNQGKDSDSNDESQQSQPSPGSDSGTNQQQQTQRSKEQQQKQPAGRGRQRPEEDQKQKDVQQQQQAQQDKPTKPEEPPQEKNGQPQNYDKMQAAALLDNLREDERNWNFFPEVQMKDLKDSGEPAKDW